MIKKIVVGIDGSEESLNAYKTACSISKITGAAVKVFYVIDQRRTDLPYMYSSTFFDLSYEKIYIPPDKELLSFYRKLRKDMKQFGENCLSAIREMDCSRNIDLETSVEEGIPFEKILEKAAAGKEESLIALGQHGENKNFHANMLGATVEEVIRKADVPVLVCSSPVKRIRKIACFGEGNSSFSRVKDFLYSNFSTVDSMVTFFTRKERGSEARKEKKSALGDAVKNTFQTVYVSVKNESALLEAVENEEFDIVLIGAHGEHKITEYILAGHVIHMVRKSSRPIIIVK